jgi:hypothetical protein
MLTAGDAAWLAVAPTAALSILAIAVLGPPLGRTLLGPETAHFWSRLQVGVHPEPVEHGRFVVALGAPLLLSALTLLAVRRGLRLAPRMRDLLVVATQAAVLAFAAICVLAQEEAFGPLYPASELNPVLYRYFTPPTLLAAGAGTAVLVVLVRHAGVHAALLRWTRETRARAIVAGTLAVVATVVWLSHGIFTESTIGAAYRDVVYHLQFTMDETFAVLDGRSPLVDFAAQYGSVLPYAYAAAMSLLGDSLGVWVALALFTTGLGMLAVYAVLRRVTHSSMYGLLLFLPVLAASFYRVGGTLDERYTFGNYYGTFPLRYAGPSLLAWLVARHLGGARPRRVWLLFLAAGLVALNNADAGIPALGATVAAVLWAGPRPLRTHLARLAVGATAGLAGAFALVSALTLLRAGALPDLGLLLRFSRLFASAGFAMVEMPTLGLHLVVFATFSAAIGLATVRALDGSADRTLTGMLAWIGVFGLGNGAYFAGRSTPENLIAMFFPWSFALALLLPSALESIRTSERARPPLAAIGCAFLMLLMAMTLAQTPTPWGQLERLQHPTAAIFAEPWGQTFVDRHTRRGEHAAILVLLGHRIGANLGVVNVSPYTAMGTMPTAEQLTETIRTLRDAGGRKLFLLADTTSYDMEAALQRAGFALADEDPQTHTTLWMDRGPR